MSGYPNVFISHASEDKQRFVLGFAARLRRAGIDAWVDQWEISPGDSLVHRIFEEGIAQADVFVIVLSDTSIEKAWVQEELNAAVVRRIEGKLRTIIAVLIDDVEVPVALQSLVWVRISNLGQYDSEFQQVVAAIGGGRDRPSLGSPLARVASSSTRSTHPVGELPPGIRPGQLPPFHLLGAYVFQELCRDLLDAEPEVAFCNIYGTSGQAQEGVDLLAHRQLMDGVDLGQCKCYRTFTAPRIRAASEEFLSHWERWAH